MPFPAEDVPACTGGVPAEAVGAVEVEFVVTVIEADEEVAVVVEAEGAAEIVEETGEEEIGVCLDFDETRAVFAATRTGGAVGEVPVVGSGMSRRSGKARVEGSFVGGVWWRSP